MHILPVSILLLDRTDLHVLCASVWQASMIISEGASKTKMKASEFHFKVQKSWFGSDVTEKIEGWKTRIFEAAGKMIAVTINKVGPPPRPVAVITVAHPLPVKPLLVLLFLIRQTAELRSPFNVRCRHPCQPSLSTKCRGT